MTYTVAMLPVSKRTYAEIESSLRAAGYEHAISPLTIDMNGIALVAEDEDVREDDGYIAIRGVNIPTCFFHPTGVCSDGCRDRLVREVEKAIRRSQQREINEDVQSVQTEQADGCSAESDPVGPG